MKRKKHRIVLEVESNIPMSEKDVRAGVDLLLDRRGEGYWRRNWLKPWSHNGIQRLKIGQVKSFTRVFLAEMRKLYQTNN